MKTAMNILRMSVQVLASTAVLLAALFLIGLLAKIIFKLILAGWNVL